jgi:uncharacterized metal-binding protein YceD (DUF177 family)
VLLKIRNEMSKNRDFEIAYVGLKPGLHEFDYHLQDSFFEQFATPEFSDANIKVHVVLDKKSNLFYVQFTIIGTVTALCDRCNDNFTLNIWEEADFVIKIVQDAETAAKQNDDDPEVVHIPHSDNFLDLAERLYENVILCLPIQKLHPDNEAGQSTCNPKVLAFLETLQGDIETTKTIELEQEPNINSLAEQLKKLKIKKDAKS